MIKPFEEIKRKVGSRGIASVNFVERRLREVLGKLHFTGNVSTSADGQVHIGGGSGAAADECDFPFAVTVTASASGGSTVTISDAVIRGDSGPSMSPTLGGRRLDSTPPPALSFAPFTGTRYIILSVTYRPYFGSLPIAGFNVSYLGGSAVEAPAPSITVLASTPADSPPSINFGEGTSTTGKINVVLATLTGDGSSIKATQGWWGNMRLITDSSGKIILNIGG